MLKSEKSNPNSFSSPSKKLEYSGIFTEELPIYGRVPLVFFFPDIT